MPNDEIHLEDKTAVGGLDRLVTNVSLAIVAVFPTFATCLVMPWKLVPQLTADEPNGRQGYLLSPGAYFPICLTVMLLIAAALTTDATLARNAGTIGPKMAMNIATTASDGDLWGTISILAPLYFIAIPAGVMGLVIQKWSGSWWTLRTSMRAAFYQMTTSISWIILSSATIDQITVSTGNQNLSATLYPLNSIVIVGSAFWIYFWFLKRGGDLSIRLSALLGATILIMIGLFVGLLNIVLSAL